MLNSLDGTISEIASASGKVVNTIAVGNAPSGICIADGAVWVANSDDRAIARVDPRTGRRTKEIPLDTRPTELACGGEAVWASSETGGNVTKLSATTGAVIRTIDAGAGASGLVLHEDGTGRLAAVKLRADREVVVVVGPEGGIASDELDAFATVGARTVRLGAPVLRTSTAGAAALAVLSVRLGRWS